jgi:G3E family GTPase
LDAAASASRPSPLRVAFAHEEPEEQEQGAGGRRLSVEERVAALAAAGDRELCVVVARPTSSPLPLAAALSLDEEDDHDHGEEEEEEQEDQEAAAAASNVSLDAVVTLVDAGRLVEWLEQEDARVARAAARAAAGGGGGESEVDEEEEDEGEDPTLAQLGLVPLSARPERRHAGGGSSSSDDGEEDAGERREDGSDEDDNNNDDEDRTLPELLADQVESADVLVLASAPAGGPMAVPEPALARAEALLRLLNPDAALLRGPGDAAPDAFLGEAVLAAAAGAAAAKRARRRALEQLDREQARQRALFAGGGMGGGEGASEEEDGLGGAGSPAWLERALADADGDGDDGDSNDTNDSSGVSRWVYRADRPFCAQRLLEGPLARRWPGVLRSRGLFWLAPRDDVAGVWQSSGGAWRAEPADLWPQRAAAEAASQSPPSVAGGGVSISSLTLATAPTCVRGPRRTRLEFLCASAPGSASSESSDLCRAKLKASLDACLLTDEEMAMGAERWRDALPDPLPPWWD